VEYLTDVLPRIRDATTDEALDALLIAMTSHDRKVLPVSRPAPTCPRSPTRMFSGQTNDVTTVDHVPANVPQVR
jgi:hypothetical protein